MIEILLKLSHHFEQVLGCVLQVPVITRWNSKYDAVRKTAHFGIDKLNALIGRLKNECNARHFKYLTEADMAVLNEYLKIMGPFAASLDRLQGEKVASQGYIMPTIISMKYKITSLDGSSLMQAFKKTALEVIDKRFSRYLNVNETTRDLVIAAVSIPQFKTDFIENVSDQQRASNFLLAECTQHCDRTSTDLRVTRDTNVQVEDDFFVSFANKDDQRRRSLEDSVATEVARYMNDDRKNINTLDEYPLVKKVFMRFNTTLSSSAPIERVFSHSKLFFRPQRNKTSPENFERSLLLGLNESLLNQKDK